VIIRNKITEFSELFYKRDDNIVLAIFWNSLYIAFLLLPLGINLPTPFFIVSIILGLIHVFKFTKMFSLDNKIVLFFPLYFIIMLISLLYTDNITDGLNILQRSLSLFLFPLIFLFVKEDASTVRKLFDFLLMGLIISFFINFSIAIYNAISIIKEFTFEISRDNLITYKDALVLGWNYFVDDEFSKLINPSYLSLYILLVLSYYLKHNLSTKIRTGIVVILFLYLFLLASIAAYLILMIMSLLLILSIRDKNRKHIMMIMFLLGSIIFFKNPRIFDFYANIKDIGSIKVYDNSTSEKARLLSWDASIRLIKEAPILGYGIGDANDVLIQKYKELGYVYNYENNYNAHNQFFQTMLQTGVLGLSVLLSIFMSLATRMKRSSNEFSVFLILLISLIFESMLVRFNGIVFFSIVIPLLLKKRSILSSRIIRNIPSS